MNTWAIVKVSCTDGKERIGIMQDNEVNEDNPKVFLMGMPAIIAEKSAIRYAKQKGLETFNGEIHETNDF